MSDLHGGTVDQLRRQLADARRAEQITAQLLDEARAELSRTRPMADAGHAYCAAWYVPGEESTGDPETDALFAAHMATTPSPGPATHVVVEVKELERLRRFEQRARIAVGMTWSEVPDGYQLGYHAAASQIIGDAG